MEKIIEKCLEYSDNGISKLNEKAFSIEGMSSKKIRIFLNSIVAEIENPKYLEVGVWQGSTFYSALYDNKPEYAVAIDNFSEFGGPRESFKLNMSDLGVNYEFYDEDCFKFDLKKFKNKFNIYFYDGGHTILDHEKALTHFYDSMEDTFIYICDDWDGGDRIKDGTRNGFKKTNLKIIKDWELHPKYCGDAESWWFGLYIAICKK